MITQPGTETQGSSRGFESIALNAKDKLYAIPEAAPVIELIRIDFDQPLSSFSPAADAPEETSPDAGVP